MANVIRLNTTDHPNLVQVLIATDTGLFDFKAQQAAGAVTLTNSAADQRKKDQALKVKMPSTGQPLLTES